MKGMRYLKRVDIGFDFFSGRSAGPRCAPMRTPRPAPHPLPVCTNSSVPVSIAHQPITLPPS